MRPTLLVAMIVVLTACGRDRSEREEPIVPEPVTDLSISTAGVDNTVQDSITIKNRGNTTKRIMKKDSRCTSMLTTNADARPSPSA